MHRNTLPLLAAVIGCVLLAAPAADGATRSHDYAELPMHFEQVSGTGNYRARGQGYQVRLSSASVDLGLHYADENGEPRRSVVTMQLVGAAGDAKLAAEGALPGRVNYLVSDDPGKWQRNLPTWEKVRASNVYPGIDVVYYGNQQRLQYDFVVQPGADPSRIQLAFEGAEPVGLSADGDLLLDADGGELRQAKPVIYQDIDGERRPVRGNFRLMANNRVTFELGDYAKDQPLVIDPVMSYGTFIGGQQELEWGMAVVVDESGNAYVAGQTASADFPVSDGAYQPDMASDPADYTGDAYVMKLDASGTFMLFATYIGGTDHDYATDLAIDASGNAAVAGQTISADFPTTPGAWQTESSSAARQSDGFVTIVSADGSDLLAATYLGGSDGDEIDGIAWHDSGSLFVAGDTWSADYPVTPGAADADGPSVDASAAFVTRLSADAGELEYSTYLSGDTGGFASAVDVDDEGQAFVTGSARAAGFPGLDTVVYPGGAPTGGAFVSKLAADGSEVIYTRFLGIEDSSYGYDIAVHSDGSAYVTGENYSKVLPVTPQAAQPDWPSPEDRVNAFVSRVGPTGNNLLFQTHLGGSDIDKAYAITVDAMGNSYVVGFTNSTDFPVSEDAMQPDFSTPTATWFSDVFVTRLDPLGSRFEYSSFLGGADSETGHGIAVDNQGSAWIVGQTRSDDFPTTPAAWQPNRYGTSYDAFLVRFDGFATLPAVTP